MAFVAVGSAFLVALLFALVYSAWALRYVTPTNKKTTETFHIAAVAGLMTGMVLGNGEEDGFSAQHKLAEHLLGHPVWTHEFTDVGIWNRIQAELVRQHPSLANMPAYDRSAARRAKASGNVMTYVRSYLREVAAACGEVMTFERGTGERKEHPLQSLRRVMPEDALLAAVVVAPKD